MKIVIDIPNKVYTYVKREWEESEFDSVISHVFNGIKNGVVLPEHHGRLIDADALEKKMCDREEELGDDRALWESSAVSVALDMFAPTIIESEEEG